MSESINDPVKPSGNADEVLKRCTQLLAKALSENIKLKEKLDAVHPLTGDQSSLASDLIQSMPVPVYCKDDEGRYLDCNEPYCELMGKRRHDIIGATILELIDTENAQQIHESDMGALHGKSELSTVEQLRLADRSAKVLLTIKKAIQLSKTQAGLIVILWDISESLEQEKFIKTQYTIEYITSIEKGLKPAIDEVMKLVFDFDWVDVGGIYLFNEDKSELSLVSQAGLTKKQTELISHYKKDSDQARLILAKKTIYGDYDVLSKSASIPGFISQFKSFVIIPLVDKSSGEVIGSMNLASKNPGTLSEQEKSNFEIIAARIELLINYAYAREALKQSTTRLEKTVRQRTKELKQLNKRLNEEIRLQKKTSSALTLSEKLYKKIFENTQDGVILFDAKTLEVRDLNIKAHEVLGYSRKEFSMLNIPEMSIFDESHHMETILDDLFLNNELKYSAVHYKKDGSSVYRNVDMALLDISGKKYILATLHNFTDTIEKERLLRASEQKFSDLQDNLPIGIFTTTPDGSITYANRLMKQMLKMDPGAPMEGKKAQEFYHKFQDRKKIIEQLVKNGKVNNERIMVSPFKGKPFWARTSIVTKVDKDGNPTHFDGTIENINAEIKAIDKAEKANKQVEDMIISLQNKIGEALNKHDKQQTLLIQKSKLESLGELAAGIAHEINQPLGIMALSIENLQTKIQSGQVTPDYLDGKFGSIHGNIRRIRKIIDHIRVFSRDQELPTLDKVNVNKVVLRSLTLIGAQYHNHNIRVNLDLDDHVGSTVGSNMKLEQAILNLLSNSKYALEDRAIHEDEDEYTKTITIRSRNSGKKIHLSILDNGTGISKKNIERIFDPFFTTKPEGLGTGLGLSIAYGIVKEMRGEIKVSSIENSYTKFDIFFPLLPEKI